MGMGANEEASSRRNELLFASGNGVLVVNEVTALFGEWSQPQSRLGSIVISQRLS